MVRKAGDERIKYSGVASSNAPRSQGRIRNGTSTSGRQPSPMAFEQPVVVVNARLELPIHTLKTWEWIGSLSPGELVEAQEAGLIEPIENNSGYFSLDDGDSSGTLIFEIDNGRAVSPR